MTALPGNEPDTITVICDHCGHKHDGIESSIRYWDVVWALITKRGWSGTPAAIGPHRCPDCTDTVEVAAASPLWHGRPLVARTTDGHLVVELHGDQDLLVVDQMRAALTTASEQGCHVLVDLADVRTIDAHALGLLVRAHQTTKTHGHRLCLIAPSRFVVAVLHTMRLRGVFPDFPTRKAAAAWLADLASTERDPAHAEGKT